MMNVVFSKGGRLLPLVRIRNPLKPDLRQRQQSAKDGLQPITVIRDRLQLAKNIAL